MPSSPVWLKRPAGDLPRDARDVPGFGCLARLVSRTPYLTVQVRQLMADGTPDPDLLSWCDLEDHEPGFLEAVAAAFGLPALEVA